ncbi:unnamed protein product [Calypogeia fissa]
MSSAMNKLKISKARTPDLPNISHLPICIHGRRPGVKSETQSACHYLKPLTSTHLSSRAPIEYSGSQHDSQQSYSQAVLTKPQNSQQILQSSGEDFVLPNNNWWNESRAGYLITKRPRSPKHEERPLQVPHNSKVGRSDRVLTSKLRAQSLLEQISNRPGPTGKCTVTEVMEQRLMTVQNCLNGMLKRLDELQESVFSIKANVKDAARESDISRKEAALHQNVLQSLVDRFDDCKKGIIYMKTGPEAMGDEMQVLIQLEELSDELKKIPTTVAEQVTELKFELLQSLKTELQSIFSERNTMREVIPLEFEAQWMDPGVEGHPKAWHDCFHLPTNEGARRICQETRQISTQKRLQRRASRCSALE